MRSVRFAPCSHPGALSCVKLAPLLSILLVGACSDDPVAVTDPLASSAVRASAPEQRAEIVSPPPPPGLVTVHYGSESLQLWPYTGTALDESSADPVNAIFLGQAQPLQIRSCLLALDGDRTAYGLPDVYPFNATWSDAIGDVQSNWAEGDGWSANYVQLQLGTYEPMRFHLRLFETGKETADGVWTVGGIHMDLMVPGTADHQALSWEAAEQILQVDLLRSGLLDPTVPMIPTGPINDAPSYRTIPAPLYNELPPELQALILGPGAPAHFDTDVPIPSDGQGTIFHLVGTAAPAIGAHHQSYVFNYRMVMPKPFCNDGTQYVLVTGPITFDKWTEVSAEGAPYRSHAEYRGALTITPWDALSDQPAGEPYPAEVSGSQVAALLGGGYIVMATDGRRAHPHGGLEYRITDLQVHSRGPKKYSVRSSCEE